MKKIKALNLKEKGFLEQILYTDDFVKTGDPLFSISTKSKKYLIKSPYEGIVMETIPVDTKVKNGSTLAKIDTSNAAIEEHLNNNKNKSNIGHLDLVNGFDDDTSFSSIKEYKGNDHIEMSDKAKQIAEKIKNFKITYWKKWIH